MEYYQAKMNTSLSLQKYCSREIFQCCKITLIMMGGNMKAFTLMYAGNKKCTCKTIYKFSPRVTISDIIAT